MSSGRAEEDSDLFGDSAATDGDDVADICDNDLVDSNVDDENSSRNAMRRGLRTQAELEVFSEAALVGQEADTATAEASSSSTSTPPHTTALRQLQAENVELKEQLALAQNGASQAKAHFVHLMAKASSERQLLLDRIAQLERAASTAGPSSAHSEHSASPSSPQPSTSTGITRGGGESQKYWAKRFRDWEDSSDSHEGPDPKKRKEVSPEKTLAKEASEGTTPEQPSSTAESQNAAVATEEAGDADKRVVKGKDEKESEETEDGAEGNAERGEIVPEEREQDSEENMGEREEREDDDCNVN